MCPSKPNNYVTHDNYSYANDNDAADNHYIHLHRVYWTRSSLLREHLHCFFMYLLIHSSRLGSNCKAWSRRLLLATSGYQ